jgi:hypothetical protein
MGKAIPIESAGWVSLETAKRMAAVCEREGVDPAKVCAHFGIGCIYELQSEDVFDALIFIGKNSKGVE